jgi:ABC-type nitrate/sulfonate/bicarbonate transport system ATPase subunit
MARTAQRPIEIDVQAAPRAGGISLDGIVKVLGGRRVLDGLDLAVPAGGRVAIVGRSGVGKSTLLSLVAGLDEPDSGEVSVAGDRSAARRLAHCALMLQRDCLLPWWSALDNACLALENRGVSRADARRQAADLFARFDLAGSEQLRPRMLSGGMRQRVAFVRTLLAGKDVLLLDEPFGALDAITRAELQEWLATALASQPQTVLLVTHDVEEALLVCDTVVVLHSGRATTTIDASSRGDGTRREIVTSPEFLDLRERALEAIG